MKKIRCKECNEAYTPKEGNPLQLCADCIEYNRGVGSIDE